jgi:hypothetical protein
MSWPVEDALGKRLRLVIRTTGAPAGPGPQAWLTVVGSIPDKMLDLSGD